MRTMFRLLGCFCLDGRIHGQSDRELGSFPFLARCLDLAAHKPNQTPADGEAQTGAAVLPMLCDSGLVEFLEKAWQLIRIDPHAGVAHPELDFWSLSPG